MTDQTPKTPTAKRSAKQPKLTVVSNKNTGTKTKVRDRVSARSANLPNGLTEKQEAFCMGVFSGLSFSDAYREAYDAENMKPATIHRQAHELVIKQRMQSLSRSDFVLKRLQDEAMNSDNSDGARVRALELLGKSVALFTDKVETEDKTERDAATIKSELQAKLDRLLG
jgi:hypothetical protein